MLVQELEDDAELARLSVLSSPPVVVKGFGELDAIGVDVLIVLCPGGLPAAQPEYRYPRRPYPLRLPLCHDRLKSTTSAQISPSAPA